ncbi:hypothetical protein MYX82_12500 [Acidobacteria bacterium AH-259-D05]|nr:hypothetical protein [Acidobacteria bacterium AH-259-D05]
MKRITIQNDRTDKYYRRIVEVVGDILEQSNFVAPVDVFVRMDLLSEEALDDWRAGRVPYLEKVVKCNLAKASCILRILRMHAHDLNLAPSTTGYRRRGKGKRTPLRFTKTGDAKLEEAYARHFVIIGKKSARRRRQSDVAS